jgi:PAS domain S-box-containing protein
VGVLFFKLGGAITDANDAFLRMAGFSREDAVAGRLRWDELAPAEGMPHSPRAADEFDATGRTTPYEREFLRRDGSRWWALFTATRLNEHEGVEFVVDITALKHAEVEARRSADRANAAVAAKNRFLATVSHDARQPLQILVGAHQRLRRAATDEGTLNTWLPAAERATDRLIRAVDQLAYMSQLESGTLNPERKVFPIRPFLSDLAAMASPRAREKGLDLVLQPCDAHVESDPDMLRSILDNLVGNAIKYTERGAVTISCRQAEHTLLIEVIDTGVGIPPEKLQEIFHEYVRLDANVSEGLGLGLAIVSREAQLLGHPLRVESTVGVGSCFRIEVPLGGVDRTAASVVS